ncbi:hypothetical protein [Apibacter adventoris]|uniref:Uncharacterized protein n=1 Tax=Apibacter adventoris TaxID=1679466 RepID=A0A2S8A4J6_9FLAO|nr:hypothetical protein [Apibacter adventoris]PQL89475.1 hypothetical protein C4S77_12600 [Apibacter adventoris]
MKNNKDFIRELFAISKTYFSKILNEIDVQQELFDNYKVSVNDLIVKEVLISEVIYHTIVLTPSIHVKLGVFLNNENIGYYSIYLAEDLKFLDEFFALK